MRKQNDQRDCLGQRRQFYIKAFIKSNMSDQTTVRHLQVTLISDLSEFDHLLGSTVCEQYG